jgi:3-hydroxyisobutyrate dehydrogenase-like beta-hydroxyacid dehydrogenase
VATIGLVGLGLLGPAVATRLLAEGHDVGFDVVSARGDALAALGGKPLASAAAVARAAEAVCTLLPSLDAVESVIAGADGLVAAGGPGQTIIQMSTISPDLTERLAATTTARGQTFLDCPISGTSAMVARGDGIIFVGGPREAFARWRPTLEAILPHAVHVGTAGQAMLLKLVANLLVALHSAAAAEALAMARRGGLDLGMVLDVLTSSAAGSRMLEVRGPMMACGEFPAQMKLDLFMKDLHLIQEAAKTLDATLPLTDVAERLYASTQAAGHGHEDLAVVAKSLEAAEG